MSGEYNIVFEVEGLDSEGGHVLLSKLLSQLKALDNSLQAAERLVDDTNEAKLYYRIVDVTHSSPLRFVLEPILKAKKGKRIDSDLLKRQHDKYFLEMGRIYRRESPSSDVPNQMLENIQKILEGQGKDFKSAKISNGSEKVELDATLKRNVTYFLTDEVSSEGSYQGRLEALNVHSGVNTFWIYPATGAHRINCKFPPGSKEMVKSALEKTVIVRGTKYYRPNANFPHRITVKEFEVLEAAPTHLLDMKGAFPIRGDETSEQSVNRIRDEWD